MAFGIYDDSTGPKKQEKKYIHTKKSENEFSIVEIDDSSDDGHVVASFGLASLSVAAHT